MKLFYLIGLVLLTGTTAAMAQNTSYETPEYSGPTAKFDNEFDRYRDYRQEQRQLQSLQDEAYKSRLNDTGVDSRIEGRNSQIQQEMKRKQHEAIRASREHILKMNQ